MGLKITCYGPRGSLPTPTRKHFSTVRYGGNTSCYYVEAGPFRIILDDGTGVSILGDALMAKGVIGTCFINLITHFHWDHIQGLPFCTPYFIGSNTFHIHGPIPSGHEATGQPRTAVETMLAVQQSNPHFPVAHECLPARKIYTGHDRQFSKVVVYKSVEGAVQPVVPGLPEYRQIGAAQYDASDPSTLKITTIPLNHPDGCLGYRIDWNGFSMAYCTDSEPFRKPHAQITKLAQGVDWLLLDGQYTETEIGGMNQGFGHGTPESCIEQAAACGAQCLVISHHDPRRNDGALLAMEQAAKSCAPDKGFAGVLDFAVEGGSWELSKSELDGKTRLTRSLF